MTGAIPQPRSSGTPVRSAKLRFAVSIICPSHTTSPSAAALARPRMRSFSCSSRRRSRMSSARPQQASSRIARLANATAMASQPVGMRGFGDGDPGIGHDRGRAHRREMMAANGDGQQYRPVVLPLRLAFDQANPGGCRADQRAGRDRDDDQHGIPDDAPLDFEGGHAGIVHGGDAAADDRAAEPARAGQRARQRDAKTDARQNDGGDQRQQRKRDVVAARNPRREGEHGDEMGRPDAEAAGGCRHAKPNLAHLAGRPCAHGGRD